ncbi:MAG: oligosaccharide biosynthesis protein Alg14-like protein [Chthoniobacteraceae bacterium]|nr:oligosaccharide biosynthesis protein Alg14-like protein [Chthoniobacteraceae bacterium]
MIKPRLKLLAISSGGGHWVQMLRLRPALVGCDVIFSTVSESYRSEIGDAPFRTVHDATQWEKFSLFRSAFSVFLLVYKERPDVIISTGSAPGFFAIFFGKCFGARTIWLDSLANAEVLSLSGRLAKPFADLWLTQWPHLASMNGPEFKGNVL